MFAISLFKTCGESAAPADIVNVSDISPPSADIKNTREAILYLEPDTDWKRMKVKASAGDCGLMKVGVGSGVFDTGDNNRKEWMREEGGSLPSFP